MNRPVSVGLVVLVILTAVTGISGPIVAATAGPAVTSTSTSNPGEPRTAAAVSVPDSSALVSQETQNFDETTFEITVHENGSATWTFRHEQLFANEENETRAVENFKAFAEEFEANETGLYDRFTNQSRELTKAGSQVTGREMEATNFRRSARIEEGLNRKGVVEMTFTWTGFADVKDGTIVAGDVFQDIYLAPDQAIIIEAGGDLTFRRVDPEPDREYTATSLEDANSVQWSGEQSFANGHPRVVFDRPDGAGAGSGSGGPTASLIGGPVSYLVAGLLVVGVGVAAVVWYRRYGSVSAETATTTTDDSAESAPESTATAAGARSQSNDGATDSESEPAPLTDDELMTDEDRVVKLIRENGGRMKQVNIVEETGWSKSKVSMLLSDMEDDGTISKLRVGRENIISLEGFEPEATKSPFETDGN